MPDLSPGRPVQLRSLISSFLTERLESKLEKLKPDDPKHAELPQQFIPANWLADAARRVSQIQAVTHSLKPTHPDAKGTNLFKSPSELKQLTVVGSHCLGADFDTDVVGNAAALDVYKLLRLEYDGRSLLELARDNDSNLAAAFCDNTAQGQEWLEAFAGLIEARGAIASHTLAKQVYWFAGQDPHADTDFHLLSPLYATSLAHRVYKTIQDDRFSEEAKAARDAKKKEEFSERPLRNYPDLAVQKLGGTKPQNISQLNSERGGNNYLLASLPPIWQTVEVKPLLYIESMFSRFGRVNEVRRIMKDLVRFLKTDPNPNQATRDKRAALIDALVDEFLQFSAQFKSLSAGWSQDSACRLTAAQKHWLDPDGVELASTKSGLPLPIDTDEQVSDLFATWLNHQLRPLPVGDSELFDWRKRMHAEIKATSREGRYD